MQIANLHDMYLAELQELRGAEMRLTAALRLMADAAAHPELTYTFARRRAETELRRRRLEGLLMGHRADPEADTGQAMQTLIGETQKVMVEAQTEKLRDAALIACARKADHYEMAAYGSAAALAARLELPGDQRVLHASLEEGRRADAQLFELAQRAVDREDAGAG
jgi:ferritin-like metal-binding protein YciE